MYLKGEDKPEQKEKRNMDYFDLVRARRSVRSFGPEAVDRQTLTRLVEAARVGPSGANRQPLAYVAVNQPDLCAEIFDSLKWAAYIAPSGDPPQSHRPTAYIVVLKREEYLLEGIVAYDLGAAVQTILLGAEALGLGSCWLKSVNLPRVSRLLGIPKGYVVDSVIALGRPDEEPVLVDLAPGEEGLEVIKYWRDEEGRHFVPKRSLKDILHWQRFGE